MKNREITTPAFLGEIPPEILCLILDEIDFTELVKDMLVCTWLSDFFNSYLRCQIQKTYHFDLDSSLPSLEFYQLIHYYQEKHGFKMGQFFSEAIERPEVLIKEYNKIEVPAKTLTLPSLLEVACTIGLENTANFLLLKNHTLNNSIAIAILNKQANILKLLIKHNVDPKQNQSHINHCELSPLLIAAYKGQVECLSILLGAGLTLDDLSTRSTPSRKKLFEDPSTPDRTIQSENAPVWHLLLPDCLSDAVKAILDPENTLKSRQQHLTVAERRLVANILNSMDVNILNKNRPSKHRR